MFESCRSNQSHWAVPQRFPKYIDKSPANTERLMTSNKKVYSCETSAISLSTFHTDDVASRPQFQRKSERKLHINFCTHKFIAYGGHSCVSNFHMNVHTKNTEHCISCWCNVPNSRDRYLLKSDGSTLISQIVSKLPSNIQSLLSLDDSDSPRKFCCRKCKVLFEKRQKHFEIVEQLEAEIIELARRRKRCSKSAFYTSTPKKTSTPGFIQSTSQCPLWPVSSLQGISPCSATNTNTENLGVKVL